MEFAYTTDITLVNPDVGDMLLTNTGDYLLYTDLAHETAQRLHCRLNFFRGDWFLNLEEGTPWYEKILVKGYSDNVVKGVFGFVISTTQGVAQLTSLAITVGADRELYLTFSAKLDDGSTFNSYDFGDFVVDIPTGNT